MRWTWILGLVALAGLAWVGSTTDEAIAQSTEPARRVQVQVITTSEVQPETVVHSVLQPARASVLSFLEGGRIVTRPVEVGDEVTEGQLLGRLDSRGLQHGVRAARAALAEVDARVDQQLRDHERSERLTAANAWPTTARENTATGVERSEALRESAQVRLSESQRRRAETSLRAPFTGTITEVFAEVGELVSPGTPIVRIVDASGLEVVVDVPSDTAAQLREGQSVQGQAFGSRAFNATHGLAFEGRVISVARQAASLRRLHPVRIEVTPNEERGLTPGLGVRMTLLSPSAAALLVPLSAVVDPAGTQRRIWRVTDGNVERVNVQLGSLWNDQIEVLAGLDEGDTIVVAGQRHLLPGDALQGSGIDRRVQVVDESNSRLGSSETH